MVERRHQLRIAALVGSLALVSACGTMPAGGPPVAEEPGGETPVLRPVSQSLIDQSRDQRRSGNYGQAAATLERAIRIDPGEPAVWLELARVRYAESNFPQAEQLARKARSLAPGGSPLDAAAVGVIADALRKQQRPQEAQELEDRLEDL